MSSQRKHVTYANVVATVALIVAVAGIPSAVAITSKLKKNSVGTKQIRNGSITAAKIADGNVTAAKLAGIRTATGQQAPSGPVEAVCGVGEALLGGGTASDGGSVSSSIPNAQVGPPRWSSSSFGGPSTTSFALCLKTTPGR